MRNVFDAILECGHDEDFIPAESDEFFATEAPAGSREKIEILAERVRRGLPLWHPSRSLRLQRLDRRGPAAAISRRLAPRPAQPSMKEGRPLYAGGLFCCALP